MGNYVGNDTQSTYTLAADGISDAVWSNNEKTLYAGTTDGKVLVFDVATHALKDTWTIGKSLGPLSLSDDGKTLVAGGMTTADTSAVFAINTATGAATAFKPEVAGTGDVEIVDNKHVLVSGNGSGQLLTLDLATGTFAPLAGGVFYGSYSSLSEDQHLTLIAEKVTSNGPLFLYDDRTGTVVASGDNYQGGVSSGFNNGVVAISEAAGRVLQFNYYQNVNIFDLNLKAIKSVSLTDGPMQGYSITPDGKAVYIYHTSGVVNEYLLSNFSKIASFTAPVSPNSNGNFGNSLHVTADGGYMSLLSALDAYSAINGLTLIDVSGRNETFRGTAGADTFAGGLGNDTYVVNHVADRVIEKRNAGDDKVIAVVDHTLAANIETLQLAGRAAINGTGNGGDNTLIGNAGTNTLDGADGDDRLVGVGGGDTLKGGLGNDRLESGAGIDTLIGGDGNDTYVVNDLGDVIQEKATGGIDTVQIATDYVLGANLENLVLARRAVSGTGNDLNNTLTGNLVANTLDGGAGDDRLLGLAGQDTLLGGAGDDRLDGGLGSDTMTGGVGDDTYVVDTVRDTIVEDAASGGRDTVIAALDWKLADGLENLTLAPGTAPLTAAGNALNNVLTGNAGNNRLDGGLGTDRMIGGLGDDTYIVDNKGDRTIETDTGFSNDTVLTRMSWTLAANIEKLTLLGKDAINGTGNDLANVITGNDASNVLDGGGVSSGFGFDTLIGGGGNDTYIVSADYFTTVIEKAGGGVDLVISEGSAYLGFSVENLRLTGASGSTGYGNTLANVMEGNTGSNVLYGYGGNDTLIGGGGEDALDGGAGDDLMQGGIGNDTFIVDSAADRVIEKASEGDGDVVNALITLTIPDEVEVVALQGTAAINATGSARNDTLYGNEGANMLDGMAGDDVLFDKGGNDTLTGGSGADQFNIGTFGLYAGSGTLTTITDFAQAENDLIALTGIDSDPTTCGIEPLTFIGTAAFSGTAGEVHYEQTAGDTYVTGDIDGDSVVDFTIKLDGLITLTGGDFILPI